MGNKKLNEFEEQVLLNQSTILNALRFLRFDVQEKWLLDARIKETGEILTTSENIGKEKSK